MGFLSWLSDAAAKKTGEMAWEVYKRSQRQTSEQLKYFIQEQTSMPLKAAVLLVLVEKDSYAANQIYNDNRQLYDSAFSKLANCHGGLAQVVDRMSSRFKSSYY